MELVKQLDSLVNNNDPEAPAREEALFHLLIKRIDINREEKVTIHFLIPEPKMVGALPTAAF